MRDPSRSRWASVVLLAVVILVVSVVPIPGPIPEGGGVPTSVPFHFLGYATLSVLLAFASFVDGRSVRATGTGFLGASAYGVLIECLQHPIPYRSFSTLDMLVNGAGATLGAVVLLGVLARSDDRR